jgi:hypothetical protein
MSEVSKHTYISFAKSIIRIVFCIASIAIMDVLPMAIGFIIAEVLGIVEEIVVEKE